MMRCLCASVVQPTTSNAPPSLRKRTRPGPHALRYHGGMPVIRDDEERSAHKAYGQGGFPFWVFLNADGTVALRTSGQLQIEQLQEVLVNLEQ